MHDCIVYNYFAGDGDAGDSKYPHCHSRVYYNERDQ